MTCDSHFVLLAIWGIEMYITYSPDGREGGSLQEWENVLLITSISYSKNEITNEATILSSALNFLIFIYVLVNLLRLRYHSSLMILY